MVTCIYSLFYRAEVSSYSFVLSYSDVYKIYWFNDFVVDVYSCIGLKSLKKFAMPLFDFRSLKIFYIIYCIIDNTRSSVTSTCSTSL